MQNTRDHILNTSFQLFYQKGFKEVTMNELVKASGLSKGAFYHYFSSKEELYQMAFEAYMDESFKQLRVEYNREKSFRQNLFDLLKTFTHMSMGNVQDPVSINQQFNSYIDLLRKALQNPELNSKMHDYTEQYSKNFEEWVSIAQQKGEIKKGLTPKILTMHIFAVLEGINVIYPFLTEQKSMFEYISEILNEFLDLIET